MSHGPDACLPLRLLSPRPSLLTPTGDARASASPQKPLDLKQLKQRAAAIPPMPPIVSAGGGAPPFPQPPHRECRWGAPQPPRPPDRGFLSRNTAGRAGVGGAGTCSLAHPSASCFLEKSPWRRGRSRAGHCRRAGRGSQEPGDSACRSPPSVLLAQRPRRPWEPARLSLPPCPTPPPPAASPPEGFPEAGMGPWEGRKSPGCHSTSERRVLNVRSLGERPPGRFSRPSRQPLGGAPPLWGPSPCQSCHPQGLAFPA